MNNKMSIKKFQRLCIKDIINNINNDEKKLLHNWLSESEANRLEFEKIKSIWNSSKLEESVEFPDVDTEWIALNNRLKFDRIESKVFRPKRMIDKIYSDIRLIFTPKLKPISAIAFGILFLIVLIFMLNKETFKPEMEMVSTANKEHKKILFSDGSTVLLNNASKIQFPEIFEEKVREVKLNGEAFFSVTKDKRPFIITTDNANVTVLGTQFNVKIRNEKTLVYVKEGKVNLSSNKTSSKSVILANGQLSTVEKNMEPTVPERADASYQLGWITGALVFNKTSLLEIADELERHYDVNITLDRDSLKDYTLTGSFKSNEVDTVLTMICLALDLKYEKQRYSYIIKSKKSYN